MNRDIVRVPRCFVRLGEKMNLLALPLFGKDAHSCSNLGFSKGDAKLGSGGRLEGVNTGGSQYARASSEEPICGKR